MTILSNFLALLIGIAVLGGCRRDLSEQSHKDEKPAVLVKALAQVEASIPDEVSDRLVKAGQDEIDAMFDDQIILPSGDGGISDPFGTEESIRAAQEYALRKTIDPYELKELLLKSIVHNLRITDRPPRGAMGMPGNPDLARFFDPYMITSADQQALLLLQIQVSEIRSSDFSWKACLENAREARLGEIAEAIDRVFHDVEGIAPESAAAFTKRVEESLEKTKRKLTEQDAEPDL